MKKYLLRLYHLTGYFMLIILIGCADSESNVEDEYLIQSQHTRSR